MEHNQHKFRWFFTEVNSKAPVDRSPILENKVKYSKKKIPPARVVNFAVVEDDLSASVEGRMDDLDFADELVDE